MSSTQCIKDILSWTALERLKLRRYGPHLRAQHPLHWRKPGRSQPQVPLPSLRKKQINNRRSILPHLPEWTSKATPRSSGQEKSECQRQGGEWARTRKGRCTCTHSKEKYRTRGKSAPKLLGVRWSDSSQILAGPLLTWLVRCDRTSRIKSWAVFFYHIRKMDTGGLLLALVKT